MIYVAISNDVPLQLAKVLQRIITAKRQTPATHFTVAISGGSCCKNLSKALELLSKDSDDDRREQLLSNWDIFLVDERFVPPEHDDSNYRAVKADILPFLKSSSLHPIEYDCNSITLPESAARYDALLSSFSYRFDCVFLGIGPDGHTASLFPTHPLLAETAKKVCFIADSPKPPAERITLSLPILNDDDSAVVFVATGSEKKEIVTNVLSDNNSRKYPCGLVAKRNGKLSNNDIYWVVDEAAAPAAKAEQAVLLL
jgi:6-phosphogluconolactonase